MIQSILALLELANGETERIRIAQGKYKMPETIKESYKKFKKELKWHKK
jgi:hypothetical protein